MKRLAILLLAALSLHAAPVRWRDVDIIRDDWGIAHVYGKSDADAVFGMIYAQAEDDFPRIERNYLLSIGRLAEAEGESEIYRDLRMKLFIDPADMKQKYSQSPKWLKVLMDAWADGLNFYLEKHPEVKPKVITRFEPWMALTFSEGSIGGDIETINLADLEAFYGHTSSRAERGISGYADRDPSPSSRLGMTDQEGGSNGIAIAPSISASPARGVDAHLERRRQHR